MKYSRTFETEADEYAFKLLRRHGYSPEAFASIIERLGENEPGYAGMSYLSSHPLSEKRARRAREAAQQK
jgi:predicted Zn-dependent protease